MLTIAAQPNDNRPSKSRATWPDFAAGMAARPSVVVLAREGVGLIGA